MKILFFGLIITFISSLSFGLYSVAEGYEPHKNKLEYTNYYINKNPEAEKVVRDYYACSTSVPRAKSEWEKTCRQYVNIEDIKIYDKFIESKIKYNEQFNDKGLLFYFL